LELTETTGNPLALTACTGFRAQRLAVSRIDYKQRPIMLPSTPLTGRNDVKWAAFQTSAVAIAGIALDRGSVRWPAERFEL
jgi:hypothetical protein